MGSYRRQECRIVAVHGTTTMIAGIVRVICGRVRQNAENPFLHLPRALLAKADIAMPCLYMIVGMLARRVRPAVETSRKHRDAAFPLWLMDWYCIKPYGYSHAW